MLESLLNQLQPDVSDEEPEEAPPAPEFVFEVPEVASPAPADCRSILICSPGAATAFVLSAFSLKPVSWRFKLLKEPDRRFPPAPKPPRFFIAEGSGEAATVVVLLQNKVPGDLANAWSEALLESFAGAREVFFLDSIISSELRLSAGQPRPQEPHLCGLWTAAWEAAAPSRAPHLGKAVAPLPCENVLESIAAALLTQCEAVRKPCMVALALQDGAHVVERCLSGFELLCPALMDLGILPSDWSAPDYREALRAIQPPPSMSIYA
mmetsp:Transcript_5760/g.10299  ORF Transcript_5760/g.10299 Transcript_5760/m.10299 type:complete len:266 (-) Transcript_5760:15-812(-)